MNEILEVEEPAEDTMRRYYMDPVFHARVHLAWKRLLEAHMPLRRILATNEAAQRVLADAQALELHRDPAKAITDRLEEQLLYLAFQLVLDQQRNLIV